MNASHHVSYAPIGRSLRLVPLLFFCSLMLLKGQVFQWAQEGSGNGWKRGNTIAVDAQGNSYVGGEFSGSGNAIAFNNNPASADFHAAEGITDGFVVKYDENGVVQWKLWLQQADINAQASASATVRSIAITSDALYITGECEGEIRFNVPGEPGSAPAGSSFIAKYEFQTSGPPVGQWAKLIGPTASTLGVAVTNGIAVYGSGSTARIYLCGRYRKLISFMGSSIQPTQTPSSALFLARYDASGTPGWIKWGQNPTVNDSSLAAAVAVTSTGDPVITGHYTGTVKPNTGTTLTLTTSGKKSVLVAQYDGLNGNLVWAHSPTLSALTDSAFGRSIAVDANGIYVTGRIFGRVDFGTPTSPLDALGGDFFLTKYASTGSPVWAIQGNLGPTGDAIGNGVAVHNNEIYLTGSFSGRMDLGNTNKITLGSLGNHDIFVAKYAQNKEIRWAQRAGNTDLESTQEQYYNQGIGIGVDNSGGARIVGEFGGTAGFFGTAGVAYPHFRNVFTAKLSAAATTVTGTVIIDGSGRENELVMIDDPAFGPDYITTGTGGAYTAYLPGDNSSTSFRVQALTPPHRTLSGPSPLSAGNNAYSIPGNGSNVNSQDFIFSRLSDRIKDLRVTVTKQSRGFAPPGTLVPYLIRFKNVGETVENNIKITLAYDSRFDHASWNAYPPYIPSSSSSSTTNPITWVIVPNLPPMTEGRFVVWLKLNDGVSQSDQLDVITTITDNSGSMVNDNVSTNNTSSVVEIVWEPSDPNGKFVMPQGNIPASQVRNGQNLKYTVEFFNVGPGPADLVTVTDDLDAAAFDLTGTNPVTMESASPFIPNLLRSGNHLEFRFQPAGLESIFESVSGSHGFITFSVPLLKTLLIGTKIRNKADIQFNALTHILTNEVENCVASDFTYTGTCHGEATRFWTQSFTGLEYLWDGPDSILDVRWNFGDGGNDTAAGRNPVHTYASPGTYMARVTFRLPRRVDICGRFDSIHTVIKPVVIAPYPSQPTVARLGDTLIAGRAAHYEWSFNNQLIPNSDRQWLVMRDSARDPNRYSVRVRNIGGCLSTSGTASVPFEDEDREITITHNPGSGPFMLELGREAEREHRFSVIDMRGTTVLQGMIPAGGSNGEIDLAGKPSGIYVVRVQIGNRSVIRRLVLRR